MNLSDPSGEFIPLAAILIALGTYATALVSAPDFQSDLFLLSQDIDNCDYGSAGLSGAAMLIPGLSAVMVKGVGKVLGKADDAVKYGSEIIERNGFKFTKDYYDKLWSTGRKAPSLIAQEIIAGAGSSVPDLFDSRFVVYTYNEWRLVIDPVTKFIQHLGP